jgi:hypothetical protein
MISAEPATTTASPAHASPALETSDAASGQSALSVGHGAIPAPSPAFAASPSATASELGFGGHATDLTPDQRAYYEQIRARDPKIPEKNAHDIAKASRPLSDADHAQIHAVQQQIATMKPRRIDDPTNPNLVQIEVAFDGSGDDRAKQVCDTETNPARLDDQFDGRHHYEKGVANDPGWRGSFEMATGVGLQNRIDGAYKDLVAQINQVKSENPAAQVVLVVTGFSRGATAARSFVNQLNQRGVPVLSSQQADGSYAKHYEAPRIGVMVLFDTVQMTPGRNYDTSIPANAENVLHITARDEHRTTFPMTHATDSSRPDDHRITEVAMPGSHSDIGGGNPNPYSMVSEQIARQYMVNAGVHMKPQDPRTVVDPNDPSLRLYNSSDGWFGMPRVTHDSHNPR